MCDCYTAECEVCKAPIPLHIGDFLFERECVKAWCGKHIPDNGVTIFEITELSDIDKEDHALHVGWQCAVSLTKKKKKIEPSDVAVYPNLASDISVTILP